MNEPDPVLANETNKRQKVSWKVRESVAVIDDDLCARSRNLTVKPSGCREDSDPAPAAWVKIPNEVYANALRAAGPARVNEVHDIHGLGRPRIRWLQPRRLALATNGRCGSLTQKG
jgi:hypothetical protein